MRIIDRNKKRNELQEMELGIPTDGLISYFRMEETSGNPIDALGASTAQINDRVPEGVHAYRVHGRDNYAIRFRQSTMMTNTNNFRTISLWLRQSSAPVFMAWQYLIEARPSKAFFISNNGLAGCQGVYQNGVYYSANTYDLDFATRETWVHIVAIADANFSGSYGLMGRPELSDTLKGDLDEIAIYNRVLTEAEVATIYNNGKGRKL